MKGWLFFVPLALWAETVSLFSVPGMHCPLCTTAVKKSLQKVEGVSKVQVRLNTKEAKVWHRDEVTEKSLLEAIRSTGYEGVPLAR